MEAEVLEVLEEQAEEVLDSLEMDLLVLMVPQVLAQAEAEAEVHAVQFQEVLVLVDLVL